MAAKAVKESSFENQLEQLETLVEKLETGSLTLDEMLETYEKGVKLGDTLEKRLTLAKARLIEIKEGKNGETEQSELSLASQTSMIEE